MAALFLARKAPLGPVISLDWTGLDFDLNPLHSIEDRVWLLELQGKSSAVT